MCRGPSETLPCIGVHKNPHVHKVPYTNKHRPNETEQTHDTYETLILFDVYNNRCSPPPLAIVTAHGSCPRETNGKFYELQDINCFSILHRCLAGLSRAANNVY